MCGVTGGLAVLGFMFAYPFAVLAFAGWLRRRAEARGTWARGVRP